MFNNKKMEELKKRVNALEIRIRKIENKDDLKKYKQMIGSVVSGSHWGMYDLGFGGKLMDVFINHEGYIMVTIEGTEQKEIKNMTITK